MDFLLWLNHITRNKNKQMPAFYQILYYNFIKIKLMAVQPQCKDRYFAAATVPPPKREQRGAALQLPSEQFFFQI